MGVDEGNLQVMDVEIFMETLLMLYTPTVHVHTVLTSSNCGVELK